MNAPTLKLTVSSVPAATVQKGYIQVTAGTRSTTKDGVKKEIPADQRSRSIIVPEYTPNVSSKYVSLVTSALTELAKTQLSQQWKESAMLTEVDAALYTEDALLLFAAREAESKKLSGANILAWYDQSQLAKYIAEKYDAKAIAKLRASLENIAAPVPSMYNEESATKRIALLGKFPEDMENDTARAMVAKLAAYVERIKKQREELGDVEEIE